jgi:O-antigen/teichoic acid export membrane protein
MKFGRATPQQSFLRSVGRTAGFNLAGTAVSAITGVMLARWLGPSGRGDYAAVTSYFGLALVFFELGLGSSVVFHVSKFKQAHADFVWTAAGLFIPLALLAALVSVVLGVTVFGDSRSASPLASQTPQRRSPCNRSISAVGTWSG